jgi:hypothetical protein
MLEIIVYIRPVRAITRRRGVHGSFGLVVISRLVFDVNFSTTYRECIVSDNSRGKTCQYTQYTEVNK